MRGPDFHQIGGPATAPGSYPQPAAGNRALAMDCEMVTTTAGKELVRCSLVNERLETVYDELCIPGSEILSYDTQFSGITAETLEGVTRTLADVQRDLSRILTPDTVLVGHSLENDLQACRIYHYAVADTALLYPHSKGPGYKPALRVLAWKHLGLRMQHDDSVGHDSVCAPPRPFWRVRSGH